MINKTYLVIDGVERLSAADFSETREVQLSESEAAYDLSLGRLIEKPRPAPRKKTKTDPED